MKVFHVVLGGLAFLVSVSIAQAGDNSCGMNMGNMSHAVHMSKFTQSYMKAMCNMMSDMEKYSMNGDASHDFAASMIPHHKAAVEMAKTLLEDKNANTALRKMAENITITPKMTTMRL